MAVLTRTAAKTRARVLLNEPTARYYSEASLNAWCDDAVRDISLKTFCNQVRATAINTTSGVYSYSFPTTCSGSAINVIGIKTITNSANISLNYVTPDLMGKASENQTELCWTDWGRFIILSPIPLTAWNLTFWCWIEASQSAAGTLTIPSPYHHLVPLYIAYKGFESKQNQVATQFFSEYTQELDRIYKLIHTKDSPHLNFIKPGMVAQTVNT